MQAFVEINEHKIKLPLPEGMVAYSGETGPGAYDYIEYRGIEIITFELDEEPEFYNGPFAVMESEWDALDLPDLLAAKAAIDEKLGAA